MTGQVPRLIRWLLRVGLRPSLADDVLGDLEERWRADPSGRIRATARLARLAVGVAWQGILEQWRPERDDRRWRVIFSSWLQDGRFAGRLLRRRRALSAAIVTTLAFGIGATTALFSVVHAWILTPLPFAEPSRLSVVWETIPAAGVFQNTPAPVVYDTWRREANAFDSLAAFTLGSENLIGDGGAERLRVLRASPELLPLLGVRPQLGRGFSVVDAAPPGAPVVLVTHAFWQSRLGGRFDAVGRSLQLGADQVRVIGVLPPGVTVLGFDVDVWTLLALSAEQLRSDENRYLWVLGRLGDGVSVAQASAEVDRIAMARSEQGTGGQVVGLHEQTLGSARTDLLVLFGASGLVLLIACANVASLTLVQMICRRPEMAARAALGASPTRLARQVLLESAVIGAVGGLAGLAVAGWLVVPLAALAPGAGARAPINVLNPTVAGFVVGTTVLVALAFGLVAAWRSGRVDLPTAIRGGRGVAGGRHRLMSTLVIGEIALAFVLLVCLGLVSRSYLRITAVDLGFDADGLVVFELPRGSAATDLAFFEALDRRLSATNGIDGVAMTQALPLVTRGAMGSNFPVEGQPDAPSILAYWRVVNSDYFATLAVPLRDGRVLTDADQHSAERVAVVSESYARRAWPDGSAIGQRIGWANLDDPMTVVGVVGEIRHSRGSANAPHVFMPYGQAGRSPRQVAVRSSLSTSVTMDIVRSAVRDLDERQPVASATTSGQLLWELMGRRRFHLVLFGGFAMLAIALAVVGIYGVLSFLVEQGQRELGIRVALGATPTDIRWLWIRRGLSWVSVALAVGFLASRWTGALVGGFLFEIAPGDLPSAVAAGGVVVATALTACLVPARRAANADPIEPLRGE